MLRFYYRVWHLIMFLALYVRESNWISSNVINSALKYLSYSQLYSTIQKCRKTQNTFIFVISGKKMNVHFWIVLYINSERQKGLWWILPDNTKHMYFCVWNRFSSLRFLPVTVMQKYRYFCSLISSILLTKEDLNIWRNQVPQCTSIYYLIWFGGDEGK